MCSSSTSGANLQNGNSTATSGNFSLSSPYTQTATTGTPNVAIAPVLTCDPRKNLGPNQYLNASCFALPTPGNNGTIVIPEAFGPGFFSTDLSLFKSFKFAEKRSVQFRAEGFNVLNHANRPFGVFNEPELQQRCPCTK